MNPSDLEPSGPSRPLTRGTILVGFWLLGLAALVTAFQMSRYATYPQQPAWVFDRWTHQMCIADFTNFRDRDPEYRCFPVR